MNNKQGRTKEHKKNQLVFETIKRLSKNITAISGLIIVLIMIITAILRRG